MVDRISEFNQAGQEFEIANTFLKSVRVVEDLAERQASKLLFGMDKIRKQWLEEAMAEQGLDLCDRYILHFPKRNEPTSPVPHENAGLFNTSEIRMVYIEQTIFAPGLTGSQTPTRGHTLVERLCPQHFPEMPDETWSHDSDGNPNFSSEVIKRDDRYVTRIHEVDLTESVESRYYPKELYQYFGLPKLPPDPDIHH